MALVGNSVSRSMRDTSDLTFDVPTTTVSPTCALYSVVMTSLGSAAVVSTSDTRTATRFVNRCWDGWSNRIESREPMIIALSGSHRHLRQYTSLRSTHLTPESPAAARTSGLKLLPVSSTNWSNFSSPSWRPCSPSRFKNVESANAPETGTLYSRSSLQAR